MHIKIRRLEPNDGPAIHDIYSCRSVILNTAQLPMPSVEQWRKWAVENKSQAHMLVATVDERPVGYLTLERNQKDRRAHTGHLAMAVHDDFQGKGIGKQLMISAIDIADNWLALVRINLTVYTDNQRALALYKNFQFEIEGTQAASALRDGRFIDEHIMGRIHPNHPALNLGQLTK